MERDEDSQRKPVVGNPQEWKYFLENHEAVIEHFPYLVDTVNLAFEKLTSDALPDLVVFCNGRLCAEDFLEILTLSGNGFGVGAMKLLRTMYEQAVTARYIHQKPDEAERFVGYDPVQKGKLAQAILDGFKEALTPEHRELLEKAAGEGKAARPSYQIADCKKCGTKRLNHTWGPDFVSMSCAVGKLGELVVPCYGETLLHAHSTVHAIESRIKRVDDGTWTFDLGPQRKESAEALMRAHLVLLNVLELQLEHFGVKGLEERIQHCAAVYSEIWALGREQRGPTGPPEA